MATRNAICTYPSRGVVKIEWTGLLNGDSGNLVDLAKFSDLTVQFTGTFGSGGTISLRGSNDNTNVAILSDPQGNAITKTSAAIEQVLESTRYYSPNVSAGDGTTDLTCTMIGKVK